MALRTKNAIRRSFIELLAERPFDKISVRDIAERSEVTRNTFLLLLHRYLRAGRGRVRVGD